MLEKWFPLSLADPPQVSRSLFHLPPPRAPAEQRAAPRALLPELRVDEARPARERTTLFSCLFDSEYFWSGWNALRGALEAGGP